MSARLDKEIATLERVPLFEGLGPAGLRQLLERADIRRFALGQVLFRQEEPARLLYVLQSGRVRVSEITVEGEEVLLRFIDPGQMLGGMATLDKTTYPVTAEAAIETRAPVWSHDAIDELIDEYPQLARNAMQLMVARISELQERYVELATERVEQRVASAVLRLAEQTGRRTAEGVLLDLQLSRQDLAAMTGTTLYTVSRMLNRWSEEGILSLGRKRVTVKRPHALVVIADNLPE